MSEDRSSYFRKYQKKWLSARRTDWIKKNGPCAICGSVNDLEIDHIDRSTKECNPTQLWSRKLSIREAELRKCQVLCSSCHMRKTKKELSKANKGVKRLGHRKITNEQLFAVLTLIKQGLSERSACAKIGIARGTFSAIKILGYRPEVFCTADGGAIEPNSLLMSQMLGEEPRSAANTLNEHPDSASA